MEITTFCIWQQYADNCWQVGKIRFPSGHTDPDGSEFLLSPYDGKPKTYWEFAKDYFDISNAKAKLKLAHVRHVYAHQPLTAKAREGGSTHS